MDKIIWQPNFCSGYDFSVHLDRSFAKEMVDAGIPEENRKRMNELANEELKRFGVSWRNPYSFHNDSCLVSQVYIGNNGVWLATNWQGIDSLIKEPKSLEPLVYTSHNVDTPRDAFVLMALFNEWIKYAELLKRQG